MRSCSKTFPGADRKTSDQFASDVSDDERAMVTALRSLRAREALSLEEVGFILGMGAGPLSRCMSGAAGVSLTSYLRIARAMGYRCRVSLEKVKEHGGGGDAVSNVKIAAHRVIHHRSSAVKRAATRSG